MKKSVKKLFVICAVIALVFSLSVAASASNFQEAISPMATNATGYWSSDTISVPGTNGSGYTTAHNVKQTVTLIASFKCTSKSNDRNFDARLVNSDNASRSSWARNLDIGTLIHVDENSSITVNHEYRCEISSDLFTIGSTTVGINFSADNIS